MNILSKLFGFNDIGIDLGSTNMRVWLTGKGLVLDEPSVVAFSGLCKCGSAPRILAFGAEAIKLLEENDNAERSWMESMAQQGDSALAFARLGVLETGAPLTHRSSAHLGAYPKSGDSSQALPHYRENPCYAVWPREEHIISDIDIATKMLRYCISKAKNNGKGKFRKPRVVIAVPANITEVEKHALEDAAHSAGVGKVLLFDDRIAAILGVGCDTCERDGNLLVGIGASAMNIALISPTGIACDRDLRVGGNEMNKAITKHMRNKHKLLIGEREAEDIKIKIGSAQKLEPELDCEIKGRDLVEGHQRTLTINSQEIREEALDKVLGRIEDALTDFIKFDVPQGLAANLARKGFVLTGGGAILRGLAERLADVTGLPVRVADDPAHATIRGIGVVLDELDFLSKHSKRR